MVHIRQRAEKERMPAGRTKITAEKGRMPADRIKAADKKILKYIKKAAAAVCCLSISFSAVSAKAVYAADSKWDIENTFDKEECSQGDTLLLSVTLKGSSTSKEQEISAINGVLEYDTSLFQVAESDILPAEKNAVKKCTFDEAEGKFLIQYSSGIKAKDASALFQIKLHVAEDAEAGKTTVCVTNLEWSGTDGKQKETIEHRVPAYLTIRETQKSEPGDVNGDGKTDLTDARLVMQHYNGAKTLEGAQLKSADVNGDGKVNLTDVKMIIQYYNGEIDEF